MQDLKAIEELSQRREYLASKTKQDLQFMSAAALKKLAVNIVPNCSRMKKNELIEGILAATKPERIIVDLVPDAPLEAITEGKLIIKDIEEFSSDLSHWVKGFYKEFRALVQSKWKSDGSWDESIYSDISGLAYRVIRYLDTHDGFQKDGHLAFTTKLRYRTYIINWLKELVDTEKGAVYYKQLESCMQLLQRQIKIQISDLSSQKKGLQERRLAERKKEKVVVDFKPIHEFAADVLARLGKLKAPDWKKVSIALAIVSGRRMAEIHLSTTEFQSVDKWTCRFKGQLKIKGDAEEYFNENPYYEIPVLVDARLVVQAHQWLKSNQKVVDTPEAASKRYSADLSDAMKGIRRKFNVQHEFFTYKGLRAIYAQVCNQVFNDNDPDNTLYLAQILGHGRGDLLRGDNLIDMLTPQSYNSDFRVINADCVHTTL